MAILCIGDSLTEGDYGIRGKSGIADVHSENYPYFLSLLTGEETRNFGKCGWRSSRMLNWYKTGAIPVQDASDIIVMLGTNGGQTPEGTSMDDLAYKELIFSLLRDAPRAKLWLCTPPHVTVNPAMSNCGYRKQVDDASAFIRSFSKEQDLLLIDLAADARFSDETESLYQPNDGLHFGKEGYKMLAGAIAEGMGRM